MEVDLWQAVLAALAACFGGGGLAKILSARAQNRHTDARTITEAYGLVIDQLRSELTRQGSELIGLRDHVTELLKLIGARDQEIVGLRAELAEERGHSSHLRERVTVLEAREAGRRITDSQS